MKLECLTRVGVLSDQQGTLLRTTARHDAMDLERWTTNLLLIDQCSRCDWLQCQSESLMIYARVFNVPSRIWDPPGSWPRQPPCHGPCTVAAPGPARPRVSVNPVRNLRGNCWYIHRIITIIRAGCRTIGMTRSGLLALCLLVLGSTGALAYEAGDNHKWTPPAFCGYDGASHGNTIVLYPAHWHMTGTQVND